MKRELLNDAELDIVTGGARTALNLAELVPVKRGSFTQKLKGIFQRMQLD